MPTTLATIQSHIDAGNRITAFHMSLSPQCSHSWPLDLEALAAELGPDFSIPDNHAALMRMLHCPKCGAKGAGMSIIISPARTDGKLG